jgi:hypothetical protein
VERDVGVPLAGSLPTHAKCLADRNPADPLAAQACDLVVDFCLSAVAADHEVANAAHGSVDAQYGSGARGHVESALAVAGREAAALAARRRAALAFRGDLRRRLMIPSRVFLRVQMCAR